MLNECERLRIIGEIRGILTRNGYEAMDITHANGIVRENFVRWENYIEVNFHERYVTLEAAGSFEEAVNYGYEDIALVFYEIGVDGVLEALVSVVMEFLV